MTWYYLEVQMLKLNWRPGKIAWLLSLSSEWSMLYFIPENWESNQTCFTTYKKTYCVNVVLIISNLAKWFWNFKLSGLHNQQQLLLADYTLKRRNYSEFNCFIWFIF